MQRFRAAPGKQTKERERRCGWRVAKQHPENAKGVFRGWSERDAGMRRPPQAEACRRTMKML
jgi:hypothetical protein